MWLRSPCAGPAGGQLRIVERLLTDGSGKTGGQLAGGVHVAEEHVGHSVACLDARAPGLQDRGHVRGCPLQLQRPSGQHHQDHRLAGGYHCLKQLFLRAGKAQRGRGWRPRLPSSWWARPGPEWPRRPSGRFPLPRRWFWRHRVRACSATSSDAAAELIAFSAFASSPLSSPHPSA